MGDADAGERLRSGPEGYLYHLADHLEDPEGHPFEEIEKALRREVSLMPMTLSVTDQHASLGVVGSPEEQGRERFRLWVKSLRDKEPEPWARILAGLVQDPSRLRSGIGARLKALSPFAGKALVTLELRYGSMEPGGDAAALFAVPLTDAGHELKAGDRFDLALDPDALAGAQVVRTRGTGRS